MLKGNTFLNKLLHTNFNSNQLLYWQSIFVFCIESLAEAGLNFVERKLTVAMYQPVGDVVQVAPPPLCSGSLCLVQPCVAELLQSENLSLCSAQ